MQFDMKRRYLKRGNCGGWDMHNTMNTYINIRTYTRIPTYYTCEGKMGKTWHKRYGIHKILPERKIRKTNNRGECNAMRTRMHRVVLQTLQFNIAIILTV